MSNHALSFLPSFRRRWMCDKCRESANLRSTLTRQKRWISRNHIRKIQVAEEEWSLRQEDIKAGNRKSMLDILEERGYVNQIVGTRDGLDTLLNEKRIGVYVGVDPTAPSMHVGHMVPFMALGWMFIHGYSATFLMGGYTAGVGDPIGRLTGREAQDRKTKLANSAAMFHQLKKLSASMERCATKRGFAREWAWRRGLVNNATWWRHVTMSQFMKVLGTGTRIGPMLGRDTVKNRLESGGGMSFSEFTYPLMQAWDWWELYQKNVQIQIGGADQFGNILAGAEAVKHLKNNDADYVFKYNASSQTMDGHASLHKKNTTDPMGFTVPLLTTSSGEKFGKSAGNAVWLDPSMTNSFDLYQFFLRTADADVERYLKLFTFLPMEEVETVMKEQRKDESKRHAQHKLALEFVDLVHGEAAAQTAAEQHNQIFNKKLTLADVQAQIKAAKEYLGPKTPDGRPEDINPLVNKKAKPLDPHTGGDVSIMLPESLVVQQPLGRILWSAGLVASRSEGQRMISKKGVYIGGRALKNESKPMGEDLNFAQITDPKWSAVAPFVLEGNVLILRTGKWRMKVITIVSDEEFERSEQTCPGWKTDGEPTGVSAEVNEKDLAGEEIHRKADHMAQEKAAEREKRREAAHRRALKEEASQF